MEPTPEEPRSRLIRCHNIAHLCTSSTVVQQPGNSLAGPSWSPVRVTQQALGRIQWTMARSGLRNRLCRGQCKFVLARQVGFSPAVSICTFAMGKAAARKKFKNRKNGFQTGHQFYKSKTTDSSTSQELPFKYVRLEHCSLEDLAGANLQMLDANGVPQYRVGPHVLV